MLYKVSQRATTCKYCKVRAYYWWHDHGATGSHLCDNDTCPGIGTYAKAFMADDTERVHDCTGRTHGKAGESIWTAYPSGPDTERTAPESPRSVPTATAPAVDGDTADLRTALQRVLGTVDVNAEQVQAMVDDAFAAKVAEFSERIDALQAPLSITVNDPTTGRDVKLDNEPIHHVVPKVLAYLDLGFNVWLVGPAGTGKSTIGRQVAALLDVEFGAISLAPNMPLSEIIGYMDATGNYHGTIQRDRYQNGGVMLWDEMDNGHPSIIAKQNMALANGHMAYPDGMVAKHDRSYTIAAANTFGTGPDRMYVGRQQLDAATLDRFWTVTVDYDEDVEAALCGATVTNNHGDRMVVDPPSQATAQAKVNAYVTFVRKLRANAQAKSMPVVFSQRASIEGSKAIRAGVPMADVISDRVRKGLSDSDWYKVLDGASVPA